MVGDLSGGSKSAPENKQEYQMRKAAGEHAQQRDERGKAGDEVRGLDRRHT